MTSEISGEQLDLLVKRSEFHDLSPKQLEKLTYAQAKKLLKQVSKKADADWSREFVVDHKLLYIREGWWQFRDGSWHRAPESLLRNLLLRHLNKYWHQTAPGLARNERDTWPQRTKMSSPARVKMSDGTYETLPATVHYYGVTDAEVMCRDASFKLWENTGLIENDVGQGAHDLRTGEHIDGSFFSNGFVDFDDDDLDYGSVTPVSCELFTTQHPLAVRFPKEPEQLPADNPLLADYDIKLGGEHEARWMLAQIGMVLMRRGNTDNKLIVAIGAAGAGKGTTGNIMTELCGGTQSVIAFNEFAQMASSHRFSLGDLQERALILITDAAEQKRLDSDNRSGVARVKSITGGDPQTVERKHEALRTFKPLSTIWCESNHRLTFANSAADMGAWGRRIRLIPHDIDRSGLTAIPDYHLVLLGDQKQRDAIASGCLYEYRAMRRGELEEPARFKARLTELLSETVAPIDAWLKLVEPGDIDGDKVSLDQARQNFLDWCEDNNRSKPKDFDNERSMKQYVGNALKRKFDGSYSELGAGRKRWWRVVLPEAFGETTSNTQTTSNTLEATKPDPPPTQGALPDKDDIYDGDIPEGF